MDTPFPGLDPYLEHPALWPDVHNRLIAAIADAAVPLVAPRYYVALERRAYLMKPDDIVFIGRPDIAVVASRPGASANLGLAPAGAVVIDVEVPMSDEVFENFLEIHEVTDGRLVTIVELLSPANKLSGDGREQYERKRRSILASYTNLVEIDLLRAGEPMPVVGNPPATDYRILISRGWRRPRAQLYTFGVRQPMPAIAIPLDPDATEPQIDLNSILHDVYHRARFDLRLDYTVQPVPPLRTEDAAWARDLLSMTL